MQERICPVCRRSNWSANIEDVWHCWACGAPIWRGCVPKKRRPCPARTCKILPDGRCEIEYWNGSREVISDQTSVGEMLIVDAELAAKLTHKEAEEHET